MVWMVNHMNRLASIQANGRACVEGVVQYSMCIRSQVELVSACKVVVECI